MRSNDVVRFARGSPLRGILQGATGIEGNGYGAVLEWFREMFEHGNNIIRRCPAQSALLLISVPAAMASSDLPERARVGSVECRVCANTEAVD